MLFGAGFAATARTENFAQYTNETRSEKRERERTEESRGGDDREKRELHFFYGWRIESGAKRFLQEGEEAREQSSSQHTCTPLLISLTYTVPNNCSFEFDI